MKKDIFTESARLAYVTRKIRTVLDRRGYSEVFLPSVEKQSQTLRKGLKMATHDEYYLIKPDVTSQIAYNLKDQRELRLFYISEVLDGLNGEWQAGIEFIGGEGRDKEVISILLEILDTLGISDFYIDIGSLKVWSESIKDVITYEDTILDALKNRNFGLIEELGLEDDKIEELWDLFNFRGKECGIKDMDELLVELDDERVFIDFGTVRPLPYYDDLILEVYSPDIGYPVGAGGSYHVNDIPAFGFALKLKGLVDLCDEEVKP